MYVRKFGMHDLSPVVLNTHIKYPHDRKLLKYTVFNTYGIKYSAKELNKYKYELRLFKYSLYYK